MNRIYSVTDALNVPITDYGLVQKYFRDYYIVLLGSATSTENGIDPLVISEGPVLNVEQQPSLLSEVDEGIVKAALWFIPVEKSPGPNAFGSGFFREPWSVVSKEVTWAVQSFFRTSYLLKELNSTHLVLLPKSNHPVTAVDYRSIACCGVIYKVIANILSDKLQLVLLEIVS